MTNPLARHEQLQKERERIAKELEELEQDETYQKAAEFKKDIDEALIMHEKTVTDLLQLFNETPTQKTIKASSGKAGKKLPWKCFTNEDTGEKVYAKSLKNPTLQKWKQEYGEDKVKSWGETLSPEEVEKEGLDT